MLFTERLLLMLLYRIEIAETYVNLRKLNRLLMLLYRIEIIVSDQWGNHLFGLLMLLYRIEIGNPAGKGFTSSAINATI